MRRKKDKPRRPSSAGPVSRRDFLRGAGVAVSCRLLAGPAAALAAVPRPEGGGVVGPGETPVTLRINGKRHQSDLGPRSSLLDTCRNHLDSTGAKRVCDRATCGACTMLV